MNDNIKVSIIVPLYKGKKYISSVLKQIEENRKNTNKYDIELIFVNDYPEEEVEIFNSPYDFKIKLINMSQNGGIHRARVEGLKHATGEFILFLDQDDKIDTRFIKSQIECIGNADAVVCRVIHGKRLHYTDSHVFEKVITKEFMLEKWCPIVSPGQVLIRKDTIPDIWKNNILKNNGADDYFLWLCMMGTNKKFALNQEVLFEHVVEGNNTSENTNLMMDSEIEMIEILKKNNVYSEVELEKLLLSLRRIHIKQLDNSRRAFLFLNKWNQKFADGISPVNFFVKRNINRIAIYGIGELGNSLKILLQKTQVEVEFLIDQNAKYIMADIPVYQMQTAPENIEAIILTIKSAELKKELEEKFNCPIFDVDEILE